MLLISSLRITESKWKTSTANKICIPKISKNNEAYLLQLTICSLGAEKKEFDYIKKTIEQMMKAEANNAHYAEWGAVEKIIYLKNGVVVCSRVLLKISPGSISS